MKLLALAAALAISGTAYAQDTTTQSTMPTQSTAQSTQATQPTESNATAPAGGLASPPVTAVVPADQPAAAPASPSVNEALPAPAPRARYPMCSRAVRDECRQHGG